MTTISTRSTSRTSAATPAGLAGPPVEPPRLDDERFAALRATAVPYSAVLLYEGPNRHSKGAEAIVFEHGRRTAGLHLAGTNPIVCPVGDDTAVCGIGIFDATVDQTAAIMDADPGVAAGVFTYQVHPVRSFPGSTLPPAPTGAAPDQAAGPDPGVPVDYRRALAVFDQVLITLPAGAWTHDSACRDWSVADVVGHCIWMQQLLRGWAIDEPYIDRTGAPGAPHPAPLAGDDPAARWRAARDATLTTLSPAALARQVDTPFGRITVAEFATALVTDLLAHACDIASPFGLAVPTEDDLVIAALAWSLAHERRGPGGVDPELPVRPGADPLTRFLGFLGRRSAGADDEAGALLSVHTLDGDPAELLARKRAHMDPVVARLAPGHGALASITVPTEAGLTVYNLWRDADGAAAFTGEPGAGRAQQASGLPAPSSFTRHPGAEVQLF